VDTCKVGLCLKVFGDNCHCFYQLIITNNEIHIEGRLGRLLSTLIFLLGSFCFRAKLNRDSVHLSARGALVATFVPKLE
jgi:hypothetical protein